VKPLDDNLDLPRLSATGESPWGDAVAELRANTPDAAELASLASRLSLQGIGVTSPPPAPASSAVRAWKKWALGAGAVSGVALWLSLGSAPVVPGSAPPQASTLASTRGVSAPEIPKSFAPRGQSANRESKPAESPSAAQPELPAPAPSASDTSAPASSATPAAAVASRGGPIADDRPRLDSAPGNRTPTAPRPSASSIGSEATSLAPLPTEIELLRDARLALKQSPARALELADSHARAFPGGRLVQERELIAISALVALGRRAGALSRANRFAEAFPDSPYRKQIGELLR